MSAEPEPGAEPPPATEELLAAIRRVLLDVAGYSYRRGYEGATPDQKRAMVELLEPAELIIADLRRAVEAELPEGERSGVAS